MPAESVIDCSPRPLRVGPLFGHERRAERPMHDVVVVGQPDHRGLVVGRVLRVRRQEVEVGLQRRSAGDPQGRRTDIALIGPHVVHERLGTTIFDGDVLESDVKLPTAIPEVS